MTLKQVLALPLSMLFLAGCAAPSATGPAQAGSAATADGGERPVLRIVHQVEPEHTSQPYDVGVGHLLDRFTEETGVDVELVTVPWDRIDRDLVISTRAGMPSGDLYAASSQQLYYLVNNDALLPLDDYLDASFDRAAFTPMALEAGTHPADGKLYLMLQSIHTRGLWYNTDYVSEPPKTLDELVALATALSRPHEGFYGLGFWGGTHYGSVEGSIAPLVWANGEALAREGGQAAWNNDATKEAIRFFADCVHTTKISPLACLNTQDYEDIQIMFNEGKLAMIMDGNYSCHFYHHSAEGRRKFAFAPFPGPSGPAPSFTNGWAWGIPQNSAQPDLAWQFIEWFQQEDVQLEHALLEGSLPTRAALLGTIAEEEPIFADFEANLMQTGRPMDAFVYYQEAMEALTVASRSYCLDTGSNLDELLQNAEESYNRKYY